MKIVSAIIGLLGVGLMIIGFSKGVATKSAISTDDKIGALANQGIVNTGIIVLVIGGISYLNQE